MTPRLAVLLSTRRFRLATMAALLLLVTVAAAWLWAHEGHAPLPSKGAQIDPANPNRLIVTAAARAALGVRTAEAKPRAVPSTLLAYATLAAPWQKHAYATTRLPGRIDKVHVRPGQWVEAGQPLAEVQSPELKDLPLGLLTARSNAGLSEKVLKDLEPLFEKGGLSAQRLVEARSKHQQDRNALEVARSKWLSLGLGEAALTQLLADPAAQVALTLPVTSPVRGVVVHADVTVGRVVDPTEHLFEVVDLSTVWVKIGVLESDLFKVSAGQPVDLTLAAHPGRVFRAAVKVKGAYLEPTTHLGSAWAELTNPPGEEPQLLPGMHGQARLAEAGPAEVLAVPTPAVLGEGAERFVLVEEIATGTESQYLKRSVVPGRQADGFTEIRGGAVFRGDRVVTVGGHELASFFPATVLRLSPEAQQHIGLRVEPAAHHVVEEVVEIDGAVDLPPDRRTFVASQLTGAIRKIHVDRGQAVKAGEVVAEVASLEFQNLQLKLVQADLEAKLLADTLKRLRDAGQNLPVRQLLEAESHYNTAAFQRDSLKQKLEAVGLTPAQVHALLKDRKILDALPLRAPLTGVVVHFDKVLGQVVKAEEPLFEVHDLSSVWVRGHVSEREFGQVRLGQAVRVRLPADPNFLAEGEVIRSGSVFGVADRALSVWVELRGAPVALPHRLLARLTLTVGRPSPVLAVSRAAVVREGTRCFVFVENKDGGFDRRAVTVGRGDDRHVEVVDGLAAGQRVAVRGAAELQTTYATLR